MHVDVYGRRGEFVGAIGADELVSFVWTDSLDGGDAVSIVTTRPIAEGQRLVWRDRLGKAHEHVCQDPKGSSGGGAVLYSDTALNSICELFGDYIEDKRPYGYTFERALEVALGPTRWEVGTVDQAGTVSNGLTFYHVSAREAVQAILECGGELETSIEVGAEGVERRSVSIRAHRGAADGHRRFAYGKDVLGVSKTEHWGAITACYGYGRGVETDSGGYGRKLTFGDINGGKDYVEDAEALAAYGRPSADGLAHVFGKYENGQCEDARQLLDETRAYLDARKVPGVTYEADVVDLVAMGREWEGVGVGDDVQIVDASFSPTLRCEGRVAKLETDLLGGTQTVTLGNVAETMADVLQHQQQQIGSLQQSSGSWDAASSATPAYLERFIASLNERFNRDGMSYTHTGFEHGSIWSSVPLDEDGRPTRSGSAIQICSQGLRIADGTKPDGSFDWRTFGTGRGFVADMITAGTLDASAVKIANLLRIGDEADGISIESNRVSFSVDGDEDAMTLEAVPYSTVTHMEYNENGTPIFSTGKGSGGWHNRAMTVDVPPYIEIRGGAPFYLVEVAMTGHIGGALKIVSNEAYVMSGRDATVLGSDAEEYEISVRENAGRGLIVNMRLLTSADHANAIYTLSFSLRKAVPSGEIKCKDGSTFVSDGNLPSTLLGGKTFTGQICLPFVYNNIMQNHNLYFRNGVLMRYDMLTPASEGFRDQY